MLESSSRNTYRLHTPALLCGRPQSPCCCCHLSPPSGRKPCITDPQTNRKWAQHLKLKSETTKLAGSDFCCWKWPLLNIYIHHIGVQQIMVGSLVMVRHMSFIYFTFVFFPQNVMPQNALCLYGHLEYCFYTKGYLEFKDFNNLIFLMRHK